MTKSVTIFPRRFSIECEALKSHYIIHNQIKWNQIKSIDMVWAGISIQSCDMRRVLCLEACTQARLRTHLHTPYRIASQSNNTGLDFVCFFLCFVFFSLSLSSNLLMYYALHNVSRIEVLYILWSLKRVCIPSKI